MHTLGIRKIPHIHRPSFVTKSYRFIYGRSDLVTTDYDTQMKNKGAYAVNKLVLRLDDPKYTEKDVEEFITSLRTAVPLYMNLKELHIDAPYAALKGQHLRDIMDIDSFFTTLHVCCWTFYSPEEQQWERKNKLEKLKIQFSDGIAFPRAFHEILLGLSKNQSELKEIYLINGSPHDISIDKRVFPARSTTIVDGIEIYQKKTMFNLF